MLWKYRHEILLFFLLFFSFLIYIKFAFVPLEKKSSAEFEKKEGFSNTPSIFEYNHLSEEILLENQRLREILHLKEKLPFSFSIVAEVQNLDPVGRPVSLILNKGRKDGIKEKMFVLNKEGALVGRIKGVEEKRSYVITILHIENRVPVVVQKTREQAITECENGLLTLKYLPSETKSKHNDLVFTSGLSLLYPKGILVGRIRRLRRSSPLLFSAEVKSAANLSSLEEVIVGGD